MRLAKKNNKKHIFQPKWLVDILKPRKNVIRPATVRQLI